MKTFEQWRSEQDPSQLRAETAWQTVERAWKDSAANARPQRMVDRFAEHTPENIQEIISLLRNADRPLELGSLADAAADALADCKYAAMLWEAFEELQPDNDMIERTNQSIIQDTEGNADLDGCAVSGDWERIFDHFLDEVRRRLLKWPDAKQRNSTND